MEIAFCSYQVDMSEEGDVGVTCNVTSSVDDIIYFASLTFTHENLAVDELPGIEDVRRAVAQIFIDAISELWRPSTDQDSSHFGSDNPVPN
jgi:hypothetical protein